MIKVLDIGGLDVKTAGLLFNPANEIHSNIFQLCPHLSDQLLLDLNLSSLTQSVSPMRSFPSKEDTEDFPFCLLLSSRCFPFTAFCPLRTAYFSLPGAFRQLFLPISSSPHLPIIFLRCLMKYGWNHPEIAIKSNFWYK